MYHIIRGISRQNIFEESSDYLKLKEIIRKVKREMKAELYAYCFMTNHVHLFIKENEAGDISKIMTKILSHYASWFNIKYLRSGTLFCNRYKIEPVEDERLLRCAGGIVQGMSGSPIIQNGCLVGAVTHVFVNDPTRGSDGSREN